MVVFLKVHRIFFIQEWRINWITGLLGVVVVCASSRRCTTVFSVVDVGVSSRYCISSGVVDVGVSFRCFMYSLLTGAKAEWGMVHVGASSLCSIAVFSVVDVGVCSRCFVTGFSMVDIGVSSRCLALLFWLYPFHGNGCYLFSVSGGDGKLTRAW